MFPTLERDEGLKWVTVVTLVFYAFSSQDLLLASGSIATGLLDLQVLLLWGSFAGGLLGALLSIIGGLLLLLPLQFFPARRVDHAKTNKIRYSVLGIWWIIFMWTEMEGYNSFFKLFITILTLLVMLTVVYVGMMIRAFIAEHVVSSIILPAQSTPKMDVMLPSGQRVKARQAILQIREAAFAPVEASSGDYRHYGGWTNVQLKSKGDARIDGAYWINPNQGILPQHEQRWIMWFLGNGEVYEMMIPDFESLAKSTGMNIFLFNYRGVSHSKGSLIQAPDLVEDGRACLDFILNSLNARTEHVVLFGHSIGGAVAAELRADHSPEGPLVIDRTFSSLGAAANSVFGMICKAIIGYNLPVPKFVVIGLLNSVFKGRMDTLSAWKLVTGPKLVLYHLDDAIIKYEASSIHYALKQEDLLIEKEVIKLGLEGPAGGGNHHNLPLQRFPEFDSIVAKTRTMVDLPPIFGHPSGEQV